MNKVTLMGNLTRDPDVRYSQGEKSTCVARYTLGIRRRFHRDGDPDSDFINCVAFGKQGEFAEKYLKKGMKIAICGRIQTGSYTDKDGIKRYTTDVVVEEHYFVESKNANNGNASNSQSDPQMMDLCPFQRELRKNFHSFRFSHYPKVFMQKEPYRGSFCFWG